MPRLAFGTWELEGRACYTAVAAALRAGIRHIDTAQAYQNEAAVSSPPHPPDVPLGLRDTWAPQWDWVLHGGGGGAASGHPPHRHGAGVPERGGRELTPAPPQM
jgi:hypothetical protein